MMIDALYSIIMGTAAISCVSISCVGVMTVNPPVSLRTCDVDRKNEHDYETFYDSCPELAQVANYGHGHVASLEQMRVRLRCLCRHIPRFIRMSTGRVVFHLSKFIKHYC